MVATTETESLPAGWLRGPGSDLTFIAGVTALALLSGAPAERRLRAEIDQLHNVGRKSAKLAVGGAQRRALAVAERIIG